MKCKIENCERDTYSLGMCHRHYMQDYRKREIKSVKYDIEEVRTWLLALERERHDMSYKTRKPAEPSFIHASPAAQKQRDLTFYNAGRYANGARDKQAVKASKDVNRYIGDN